MKLLNCRLQILQRKEKLAEEKQKAETFEHENREVQHNLSSITTKYQKLQYEHDQSVTQLTFDIEHYKGLYDELKSSYSKNEK